MTRSSQKQMLQELATKQGIAHVGMTSAAPFFELRERLEATNARYKGFVEQNIELRLNPLQTMPQAKSIVVALDRIRLPLHRTTDYHITLKAKLQSMAEELQQIEPFAYQIFVDTGPLCERELAVRAGLGFIGKNHCFLTKNGSMFNIGYMLTTLPLNEEPPMQKSMCGGCDLCLRACPTDALATGDFTQCLSYISQQKNEIDPATAKKMGGSIYGCLRCQQGCPYNSGFDWGLEPKKDELAQMLEALTGLSNKAFQRAYGHTAVGFIGKNKMLRNVRIALENQNAQENGSGEKWGTGTQEDCAAADWKN